MNPLSVFAGVKLAVASAAAALVLAAAPASAFPDRAITLIVPFDAGGSADIVGRILADALQQRVGQTVIVENRPGAGGAVGSEQVARSPNDGYTLLLGTISTHAINSSVYANLPYDPIEDFEPIIQFGTVPYLLVVPATLDVTTLDEFLDYARAQPSALTYGSAGIGTANHLAGALLATEQDFAATHIPYRGGAQAIVAVLSGETDFMFYPYLALLPYLEEGTLQALAITSEERIDAVPEVPTMIEAGIDFELSGFFGVYAPAGTPEDVVSSLQAEIFDIINTPEVQEQLLAQGVDPVSGTSEEFATLMRNEIVRWEPVVIAAGAQQD